MCLEGQVSLTQRGIADTTQEEGSECPVHQLSSGETLWLIRMFPFIWVHSFVSQIFIECPLYIPGTVPDRVSGYSREQEKLDPRSPGLRSLKRKTDKQEDKLDNYTVWWVVWKKQTRSYDWEKWKVPIWQGALGGWEQRNHESSNILHFSPHYIGCLYFNRWMGGHKHVIHNILVS